MNFQWKFKFRRDYFIFKIKRYISKNKSILNLKIELVTDYSNYFKLIGWFWNFCLFIIVLHVWVENVHCKYQEYAFTFLVLNIYFLIKNHLPHKRRMNALSSMSFFPLSPWSHTLYFWLRTKSVAVLGWWFSIDLVDSTFSIPLANNTFECDTAISSYLENLEFFLKKLPLNLIAPAQKNGNTFTLF